MEVLLKSGAAIGDTHDSSITKVKYIINKYKVDVGESIEDQLHTGTGKSGEGVVYNINTIMERSVIPFPGPALPPYLRKQNNHYGHSC